MITLNTNDYRQLILLLQHVEMMQTREQRRQLLEFAGLGQLISLIHLDGAPFVASSTIVTFLANYGQITYDNESLGLFLNAVKTFVGVQQQRQIDQLLLNYDMMPPTVAAPDVSDWQAPDTAETVLEKILGENTLRPIAFLAHGLKVAKSVALVRVDTLMERWTGTGFLVAPNLLLTNQHVVPTDQLLPHVCVRFNYQEDFAGQPQPIEQYGCKSDGVFHANKDLDYALLELDGDAGAHWGYLPLTPRSVQIKQRINIIQHPYGQPKQISLQNNLVEYVGSNVLQYITSTDPGSSGSPVLDDSWQVVGLHHAGGRIQEPTTRRYYNRNEGIQAAAILNDLPTAVRQRIDEAAAGNGASL